MAWKLVMPKLGLTMETGKVGSWRKKEGDPVKKGEVVADILTEKIEYELESPADGILFKILVPEGEEVAPGTVIGIVAAVGETLSEADIERLSEPEEVEDEEEKPEVGTPQVGQESVEKKTPTRIFASPAAKKLAKELGVDLSMVKGTGPRGRITKEDVIKFADSQKKEEVTGPQTPKPTPSEKFIPFEGIRATIKKRLTQAWQAPRVAETVEVDATNLVRFREKVKNRWPNVKISYNDIFMKAIANVLRDYSYMNGIVREGGIELADTINLGMAVDTEKGLVSPVIKRADEKSLVEIAREARRLAEKARSGKLEFQDLEGGTFSVSNLGAYELDWFTPVLNPPQIAIIGIGAIKDRPVVINGGLHVRPTVKLTLVFDHRAVDGAPAAAFLKGLKDYLENLQEL